MNVATTIDDAVNTLLSWNWESFEQLQVILERFDGPIPFLDKVDKPSKDEEPSYFPPYLLDQRIELVKKCVSATIATNESLNLLWKEMIITEGSGFFNDHDTIVQFLSNQGLTDYNIGAINAYKRMWEQQIGHVVGEVEGIRSISDETTDHRSISNINDLKKRALYHQFQDTWGYMGNDFLFSRLKRAIMKRAYAYKGRNLDGEFEEVIRVVENEMKSLNNEINSHEIEVDLLKMRANLKINLIRGYLQNKTPLRAFLNHEDPTYNPTQYLRAVEEIKQRS